MLNQTALSTTFWSRKSLHDFDVSYQLLQGLYPWSGYVFVVTIKKKLLMKGSDEFLLGSECLSRSLAPFRDILTTYDHQFDASLYFHYLLLYGSDTDKNFAGTTLIHLVKERETKHEERGIGVRGLLVTLTPPSKDLMCVFSYLAGYWRHQGLMDALLEIGQRIDVIKSTSLRSFWGRMQTHRYDSPIGVNIPVYIERGANESNSN